MRSHPNTSWTIIPITILLLVSAGDVQGQPDVIPMPAMAVAPAPAPPSDPIWRHGSTGPGSAALFIGINDYRLAGPEELRSLYYAVDDAVAQAHLFVIDLKLIPASSTWLALSGDPRNAAPLEELKAAGVNVVGCGKAEILKTLDRVAGGTAANPHQKSDYVVVSMSSHGLVENGVPYLLSGDALLSHVPDTCISEAVFDAALGSSAAGTRILILDACRDRRPSGSKSPAPADMAKFVTALQNAKGYAILTSCASEELSWEDIGLGHGVFTYFLIDGLRGGAKPANGPIVLMSDLANYLKQVVPAWSTENKRPIQTPQLIAGAGGGQGIPLRVGDLDNEPLTVLTERAKVKKDPWAMLLLGVVVAEANAGLVGRLEELAHPWRIPDEERDSLEKARGAVSSPLLERSNGEALNLFEAAAEANLPAAMTLLGRMHELGIAQAQSDTVAVKWYRKAVAGKDPAGMTALATMHFGGRGGVRADEAQGMQLLVKAAELGDGHALELLGTATYYGQHGLTVDLQAAAVLYRRSAEAECAVGMTDYGSCLQNGADGNKPNPAEAVVWFRKAALRGESYGIQNLAWACLYGKGVALDEVEALLWYQKGAELGSSRCMTMLGVMSENGQGKLPKNDSEAANWYKKGAEAGDELGMTYFGDALLNGQGGLSQSPTEAIKWFQKAAEAGDAAGATRLGSSFENGTGGLPKDIAAAVHWYRIASDRGDFEGMRRLGMAMRAGQGNLPVDAEGGTALIKRSAQGGNTTAQLWMNEMDLEW